MRPTFIALLAALALLAGPAAARSGPQTLTLPGGRTLSFRCMGKGTPVTLLEAGWSASSALWYKVQPELAKHGRVCAFDRAGEGASSAGPLPRTPDAIAQDLRAATQALRLPGPYILVGHSAGGLYVLRFARLFPEDAAAYLLVDPSPRHIRVPPSLVARARNCLRLAAGEPLPEGATPPKCGPHSPARQKTVWSMRLSELETLGLDDTPVPPRPAIVLTATGPAPDAPETIEKMRAQGALVGVTPRPVASGHMIPLDAPAAIIAAAQDLRAAVRSDARPRR